MRDKIVHSSFWDLSSIVSSTFLAMILQLCSTALLTHILGTNGYGKFTLFLMVANLFFLFGISWSSAAIIRYGREEFVKEHRINKTFWARNAILVPIFIILLIGLIFFRNQLLNYIGFPDYGFLLLALYVLGNMFLNYIQYIQQAVGQMKLYASTRIAQSLFLILGIIAVMVIHIIPKNVSSVVVVSILTMFAVSILYTVFFDRKWFFPLELDKDYLKKVFIFSYPIIFGSGSAYVVKYIDIIVIKKYLALSDIGVYSLSYRGFMVLQAVSMSLIAVLGPMMITFLAENREDIILRFIKRIVTQGVLFWSLFLSLIILVGSFMIPVVFGRNFQPSILPFSVLMVGLGFNLIGSFYSPILTTYELIKQAMVINVIMALVNLAGDLFLVPRMGIVGAAFASSISFFLSAVLYLFITNRHLFLNEWKQVFAVSPLIVSFIIFIIFHNVGIQLLGIIGVIGISLLFVRETGMFKKDDLNMYSKINMPFIFRRTLTFIYNFLSA